MKSNYVLGLNPKGFHRIHYTEWGDAQNPRIVVCVHGLTRTGRDFDFLAQALEGEFRVICPDVVGRGKSGWLAGKGDYSYPQYLADMAVLIARATAARRDASICWVGTSMGGIIGMLLAAQPRSPIARLVVNDIGAYIPKSGLERIGTYVGTTPHFDDIDGLERHLRTISAGFGPLTDAQWRHLALHGGRQLEDGSWTTAYDPAIALPFEKGPQADVALWSYWDAIRCPTLLVRGAESDLFMKDTALEMTRRGPRPQIVEFEGTGHAPMLMANNQIEAVREFLRR